MRHKILPQWQGFVPMYIAHPLKKCAVYHCTEPRYDESRRYCKKHCKQYDKEAEQTPTKVLPFVRPT